MMLLHYAHLALKSMRRNPLLSAVTIAAIALGITISSSFITMYHVLAKDPVPGKTDRLHYVRMDSWDPARPYPAFGDEEKMVPPQITYRDMRGIMRTDIPVRQTGAYEAAMFVHPDPERGRPFRAAVRMAFSDFFEMFEVPFAYGGPWDKAADEGPEAVAVIDQETNDKLFGGGNSVGRTFRLEDREFKVAGVLAPWRPALRMYEMFGGATDPPEPVYIPFNHVEPMEVRTAGNTDGWGPPNAEPGFKGFLNSETCWIQMWVELKDDAQKAAYEDFLEAYVLEQKKVGRFQRPIDNRVTSMHELMAEWNIVPDAIKTLASISILFLAVCSLNLMGLLLGKFLARAPEVGVRRALGASRAAIFIQHIVECEVIGVIGGAIGMTLSLGVLALFNRALPFGDPFHFDAPMIAASIFLSLGAGLLAGLYPAWRICTIPPASHLRLG